MICVKIGDHLQKLKGMEKTLNKLDEGSDYEAIVELCMLISAHYTNAALHKLRITPADRDIKHNRLAGEIGRRRVGELLEVREPIVALEQLSQDISTARVATGGLPSKHWR